MDFTILHFAIHIVWRANVICTYRKSSIARKTTVAYPELRLTGSSCSPSLTDAGCAPRNCCQYGNGYQEHSDAGGAITYRRSRVPCSRGRMGFISYVRSPSIFLWHPLSAMPWPDARRLFPHTWLLSPSGLPRGHRAAPTILLPARPVRDVMPGRR